MLRYCRRLRSADCGLRITDADCGLRIAIVVSLLISAVEQRDVRSCDDYCIEQSDIRSWRSLYGAEGWWWLLKGITPKRTTSTSSKLDPLIGLGRRLMVAIKGYYTQKKNEYLEQTGPPVGMGRRLMVAIKGYYTQKNNEYLEQTGPAHRIGPKADGGY
jgi:hypothetical protein